MGNTPKHELEERRRRVAEMLLQKVPIHEIISRLGVHRLKVYADIRKLRDHWRDQASGDIGSVIAQELASLAMDESQLRERWQVEIETDRWLRIHDRILKVMERRADMLGLDAPEEVSLDASTINEIMALVLRIVVPYLTEPAARVALADQLAAIRQRYVAGPWSPEAGSTSNVG